MSQGDSPPDEGQGSPSREGNRVEIKADVQHSDEPTTTGQTQDAFVPRQRKLKEKGLEERLNRLKQQCTNVLRATSQKRTEISQLIVNIDNLHLVKNELANLDDLNQQYIIRKPMPIKVS